MKGASEERREGQARVMRRLEALNARFYERYATQFDGTRMSAWEGWETIISELPRRAPFKVLDLGCGNGRLARVLQLAQERDPTLHVEGYRGLDRCEALLEAAERHAHARGLSFPCSWARWGWGELDEQASASPWAQPEWGWVTLFGVTHHVFSFERRLALLSSAARCLAPGGRLSVSFWDFGASERWRGKQASWERVTAEWGDDRAWLEEGDALLGWGGSHETLRYCHWVSPDEELRLSDALCALHPLKALPPHRDPKGHNRYRCWVSAP